MICCSDSELKLLLAPQQPAPVITGATCSTACFPNQKPTSFKTNPQQRNPPTCWPDCCTTHTSSLLCSFCCCFLLMPLGRLNKSATTNCSYNELKWQKKTKKQKNFLGFHWTLALHLEKSYCWKLSKLFLLKNNNGSQKEKWEKNTKHFQALSQRNSLKLTDKQSETE